MADKEQQDRRAQYSNELRAALTAHHDLTDKCRGCKRSAINTKKDFIDFSVWRDN